MKAPPWPGAGQNYKKNRNYEKESFKKNIPLLIGPVRAGKRSGSAKSLSPAFFLRYSNRIKNIITGRINKRKKAQLDSNFTAAS
jgi:hypothetical protein